MLSGYSKNINIMGLTDSEIRAILADANELSESSDKELASEENSKPEDLVLSALQNISSSSDFDDDF